VALAGHAMMVDRRTLDRPPGDGLISHLRRRGLAVLWFDLRGHGRSGPRAHQGADWSFDDLVERDTPALLRFARSRFPALPVVAVGHSLFGPVMLAHLARHPETSVSALAMLACNPYQPGWRRRPSWYWRRRLLLEGMALVARRGAFPSRRLGVGTSDESRGLLADFVRWARVNDWRARDGFSYRQHVSRVRTRVLALAGEGDRLFASPEDVRELVAPIPGATVEVVGRQSGLGFDPGHMAMVLDARMAPVWARIADFLVVEAHGASHSS
jgi:predicted alpha/beta hydrolase